MCLLRCGKACHSRAFRPQIVYTRPPFAGGFRLLLTVNVLGAGRAIFCPAGAGEIAPAADCAAAQLFRAADSASADPALKYCSWFCSMAISSLRSLRKSQTACTVLFRQMPRGDWLVQAHQIVCAFCLKKLIKNRYPLQIQLFAEIIIALDIIYCYSSAIQVIFLFSCRMRCNLRQHSLNVFLIANHIL